MFYAVDPMSEEMGRFLEACGSAGVPVLMAVRLEDRRQRHPNDGAGDLAPWHIRAFIRRDLAVRVLVTGADRGFIEQVHFGSTSSESERVWWDISWIWGPPEDDLATLLETIGVERFVFGTGQPLRLPEASLAKLDLIDRDGGGAWRSSVEADNARRASKG
jgi:predicted TIM-barrel fold metal-dependent hydrolase